MQSSSQISLRSYARLVRGNANFRRLWLAQIISETGDWFYVVALYTMLLQYTGRAGVVGLAFVFQVLPQTLTGPLAGVVNDRLRRKRVMISSDVARFFIVGCMLLVRSPRMVWLVYPLLALETVMWGMFEPARNSVIPNIVAEEDVIVANTLSGATWSLNLFVGSALGGVVAAFLGRDVVFGLDALSFLGSAALVSRMFFREPHSEQHSPLRLRDLVDYSPLVEGVRYVRSQSGLAPAVCVKGGLGIIGASWIIFTVMGERVFPVTGHGIDAARGGVLGMSLLMGARGLGALIGPIATAPWAQQRLDRLRLGIFAGFLLYGAGYVALSLARRAGFAYAVVAFSHLGGALVWVFSTTLLQLMTEDRFRGRVFSADLSLCTLMLAVTAYASGAAIDRGMDVRTVALVAGVFTLAVGMAWGVVGVRGAKKAPEAVVAG